MGCWVLTLVVAWLARSWGSPLLPSVTRVLYHMSLAQEKIKIQGMDSTQCKLLLNLCKVKKSLSALARMALWLEHRPVIERLQE